MGNSAPNRRRKTIIWPGFLLFLTVVALVIAGGVALLRPAADKAAQALYPRTYRQWIEEYSEEYGMDTDLIYAVAKTESNFDPKAHSDADARGVMQLTKDAFEWVQYRTGDESGVTYDDIFEPEVAIKYGVRMLSLLKQEMGDDPRLILASYHAGMGAVKGWLKDPEYSADGKTLTTIPYRDTNWYVEKVLETRDMYRKLY